MGKKTSRESIFEPNYSSLVIVSKADTFDNKAFFFLNKIR